MAASAEEVGVTVGGGTWRFVVVVHSGILFEFFLYKCIYRIL